MKNITELNNENFEALVLKSEIPVIVKFGAVWCGPCRTIEPIIEEISNDYLNKAKVYTIDIDNSPELGTTYGIRNIPAILFFKDGQIVDKSVGVVSKQSLAIKLDTILNEN